MQVLCSIWKILHLTEYFSTGTVDPVMTVTYLNTGHMGSVMSFSPWSKEENQAAEVESSRQFDQRRFAFSWAERDR